MNLISKRIGIDDHFPIDRYTSKLFPDSVIYEDIVKNDPPEYGKCIKNVYKSDEWIKCWIKSDCNKLLGKNKSLYVYNVSYDGVSKPTKKHVEDHDIRELYKRTNGVIYFDFDNINREIADIIKVAFHLASSKHREFQWFEYSWSGEGCHIRSKWKPLLYNCVEWQFNYMNLLNELMICISKHIDTNDWYNNNIIDWSCSNITRGFAIPYNKDGVDDSKYFELCDRPYKNERELEILANIYLDYWHPEIRKKFLHNIGIRKNEINNQRFTSCYSVNKVSIENVEMQEGTRFDYNWRLKCVTTLMNIYEGDKDKVRNACKFIYSFIKPYKNHTYEEMIGDELENKIFANGDMTYNASIEVIEDLEAYFGFDIKRGIKTNEVYVDNLLADICKL